MTQTTHDEKIRMVEEGKIAEVLSLLTPEERQVVISHTKTAITVFQSYQHVLEEGA